MIAPVSFANSIARNVDSLNLLEDNNFPPLPLDMNLETASFK